MLPHLKKCCCFFSLRRGCFIIVILDICTHLSYLNFGNYGLLWRLSPLVHTLHHVSCVLLVMGSIVKSSILMMPYLISDIMQFLFFASTSYIWFQNPSNTTVDRSVAIFNLVHSCYAWLIVYSHIQVCRQQTANESSETEILYFIASMDDKDLNLSELHCNSGVARHCDASQLVLLPSRDCMSCSNRFTHTKYM